MPPPPPGRGGPRGSRGKVFVGGIHKDMEDDALKSHFDKFGEIVDWVVIRDRETRKSRGFGFVTFQDPRDARVAIEQMNHKEVEGRTMHVVAAEAREGEDDFVGHPGRRGGGGGGGGGVDHRDFRRGGGGDRDRDRFPPRHHDGPPDRHDRRPPPPTRERPPHFPGRLPQDRRFDDRPRYEDRPRHEDRPRYDERPPPPRLEERPPPPARYEERPTPPARYEERPPPHRYEEHPPAPHYNEPRPALSRPAPPPQHQAPPRYDERPRYDEAAPEKRPLPPGRVEEMPRAPPVQRPRDFAVEPSPAYSGGRPVQHEINTGLSTAPSIRPSAQQQPYSDRNGQPAQRDFVPPAREQLTPTRGYDRGQAPPASEHPGYGRPSEPPAARDYQPPSREYQPSARPNNYESPGHNRQGAGGYVSRPPAPQQPSYAEPSAHPPAAQPPQAEYSSRPARAEFGTRPAAQPEYDTGRPAHQSPYASAAAPRESPVQARRPEPASGGYGQSSYPARAEPYGEGRSGGYSAPPSGARVGGGGYGPAGGNSYGRSDGRGGHAGY